MGSGINNTKKEGEQKLVVGFFLPRHRLLLLPIILLLLILPSPLPPAPGFSSPAGELMPRVLFYSFVFCHRPLSSVIPLSIS